MVAVPLDPATAAVADPMAAEWDKLWLAATAICWPTAACVPLDESQKMCNHEQDDTGAAFHARVTQRTNRILTR